ncbi:MAG TPA: hypothetical protein VJ861_00430 [Treponemataceae bacterium]|nr:hypothetical protein [Treponemataceae bacterium]
MRLGFKATGKAGYWGYKWRKKLESTTLYIWKIEDISKKDKLQALESIESEVVYHYRTYTNQWPAYQTEIHFYETTLEHRELALEIYIHVTNGDER